LIYKSSSYTIKHFEVIIEIRKMEESLSGYAYVLGSPGTVAVH